MINLYFDGKKIGHLQEDWWFFCFDDDDDDIYIYKKVNNQFVF
jgi:hypothetical protein